MSLKPSEQKEQPMLLKIPYICERFRPQLEPQWLPQLIAL